MAKKRSVDQILNETLPGPSKDIYKKKWDSFKVFFGNKMKPAEADYITYFDHLHTERGQKASTIWTTYSMLNAIHQREYGERLQSYPRITQLLKSYGATYERKVAYVFQKKDIENYLSLSEESWNAFFDVLIK